MMIAVLEQADGPADRRLGADMADAGAARAAAEPAVGDQGDRFAQPRAHDVAGGAEHLLHARPALGAFVADDDHVARFDLARQDAFARLFLAVEDDGRTEVLEHGRGHARGLDHGAVRGEVAAQDGQPAGLGVGVRQRVNHLGVLDLGVGDVLAQRLAGHGGAVEVQQVRDLADLFEDRTDAARRVHVLDVNLVGRRRDLADIGAARGDRVDAVEVVLNARLTGQGQRVQDGIGRAAHRHVEHQGVVHRLEADDIERLDVLSDQLHDLPADGLVQVLPLRVHGQNRAVAGQGHADRLRQAVHRVGGEHAGATAAGGAARAFELVKLGLR